ncbi:hypothetical protein [Streptomyces halobius]|uniref:Lipoprotein n=1 Tax=Streptomyces halobius TaxID=2879846 RepID=A0ABY4MIG6_9ACTN|nr:hypothetical protein [Streptomyces halobius]UQA97553.1 hypothetical protein K9S39_41940 [Streptomyces halobius]
MTTTPRSVRLTNGTKKAALCAVAASALLAGCSPAGSDQTESTSYEVKESVSALRMKNTGGKIEVVASDSKTIRVTETYTFDADKPKTEHSVSGNKLNLVSSGCGGGSGTCDVDYRVQVPRTMQTHLENESGSITVHGLSGATNAQTGAAAST